MSNFLIVVAVCIALCVDAVQITELKCFEADVEGKSIYSLTLEQTKNTCELIYYGYVCTCYEEQINAEPIVATCTYYKEKVKRDLDGHVLNKYDTVDSDGLAAAHDPTTSTTYLVFDQYDLYGKAKSIHYNCGGKKVSSNIAAANIKIDLSGLTAVLTGPGPANCAIGTIDLTKYDVKYNSGTVTSFKYIGG